MLFRPVEKLTNRTAPQGSYTLTGAPPQVALNSHKPGGVAARCESGPAHAVTNSPTDPGRGLTASAPAPTTSLKEDAMRTGQT